MFSWDAACTGRAAMSLDIINIECTPAIKLSQVKPAMTELPTCQTSPICFLTLRPSMWVLTKAAISHYSCLARPPAPADRHGEVARGFFLLHICIKVWKLGKHVTNHSQLGGEHTLNMKHLNCSRMREMFQFSSSRWEIRITAFIIQIYCFGNGYLNTFLLFLVEMGIWIVFSFFLDITTGLTSLKAYLMAWRQYTFKLSQPPRHMPTLYLEMLRPEYAFLHMQIFTYKT